jgi:phosphatidylserine/phosphatidylglycerophosphate/cardiolipin synthase-like enzyme
MIDFESTFNYNLEIEEIALESLDLLNTTGLNLEIENMFKEEKHFILILSPYLDITDKIQAILSMSPARVIILYREIEKKSKKEKIEEFKESMPDVEFYCLQNFHAKAYITSSTLIIASLNLYEHSQIYNFELGIILKDISYNKMISKLFEELRILLKMNNLNIDFDINILENIKLPTIDELFYKILSKSGKKEKDYPDKELLKQFSKLMMNKYTFDRKDRWRDDENILQRWAVVNSDMYDWALENITL